MRCHVCQADIPLSNISVERLLAKCASCPAVFNFTMDQLPSAEEQPSEPRISRPPRIQLVNTLDRRELSFRWFQASHILMAFFCVFWDGFLFVWYDIALNNKNSDLSMILFPLLHVVAGIGITYATLAGFLNRTRIFLADEHLIVRHEPLPWRGNLRLPMASINQLRCDEHSSRDSQGRASHSYSLRALLLKGTNVPLVSSHGNRGELLFIKQQLEQWLRIKDSSAPGGNS